MEKKRKGGCKKDGFLTRMKRLHLKERASALMPVQRLRMALIPPLANSCKLLMKSAAATTGTHVTILQSTEEEIHTRSSAIWRAELWEVQNLCPHKSHTLTLRARRREEIHGGQTSLQALWVALYMEKLFIPPRGTIFFQSSLDKLEITDVNVYLKVRCVRFKGICRQIMSEMVYNVHN